MEHLLSILNINSQATENVPDNSSTKENIGISLGEIVDGSIPLGLINAELL